MELVSPYAVSVNAGPTLGRGGDEAGLGGGLGLEGELGLGRAVAVDAMVRGGYFADSHVGADALLGVRAWLKPYEDPVSFSVVGRLGAP
jgi:hypothetical protein